MRPARQQAPSAATDAKAVTAHERQGVLPVFPGLCLTSSLPEKKGAHWEGVKCQVHKEAVQAGCQPGRPTGLHPLGHPQKAGRVFSLDSSVTSRSPFGILPLISADGH